MDNQAQQTQTGIFFITKFLMPRRNEVNNLRSVMKQKLLDSGIGLNKYVRYYTGNTAIPKDAIMNDEITIYYGIVNDKNELVKIVVLNNDKLKNLLDEKKGKGGNGDRLNPPKDLGPLIVGDPVWDKENDKQGAK